MTEPVRLHPDEREAIAQRVAELLRDEALARSGREPAQLLTAAEVAKRFGVSREWVYEHKARLGAIAITDGPRPRLRFDPERVAAVLAARDPSPAAQEADSSPRRRRQAAAPSAELLPIRGRRS